MPGSVANWMEEQAPEWWARWWAADYSWEGLARQSVYEWMLDSDGQLAPRPPGAAPEGWKAATLQDYWRAEAPYLIGDYKGRSWTAVHLPQAWEDGAATDKQSWTDMDWNALEQRIKTRLEAATEAPALLRGAVLRFPLSLAEDAPAASIDATGAAFTTLSPRNLRVTNISPMEALFTSREDIQARLNYGWAKFDGALFLGDAWFFSSTVEGTVSFDGAIFTGPANFDDATFGEATFIGAVFRHEARFDRAKFGKVQFDRATFEGLAQFNGTRFRHSIQFHSAEFKATSTFRNTSWPLASADYGEAFRDVTFTRLADFEGGEFIAFAAFAGARLNAVVRLSPAVVMTDSAFARAVRGTDGDHGLQQLENGMRALKLGAENLRDRLFEQRYYRFELRARRRQSSTSLVERLFSDLYQYSSDYGGSLTRPLHTLLGVIVTFTVIYWLIAGHLGQWANIPPLRSLAMAFQMSGRNTFKLFDIWSAQTSANSIEHFLLVDKGAWISLAVRLIASTESILAGVLIFLTALAVRRKFQIS